MTNFSALIENPALAADVAPDEARELLMRLLPVQSGLMVSALAAKSATAARGLISVQEAAEILGLRPSTLYHDRRGRFDFVVRNGDLVRVDVGALDKWIARNRGQK